MHIAGFTEFHLPQRNIDVALKADDVPTGTCALHGTLSAKHPLGTSDVLSLLQNLSDISDFHDYSKRARHLALALYLTNADDAMDSAGRDTLQEYLEEMGYPMFYSIKGTLWLPVAEFEPSPLIRVLAPTPKYMH